MRVEAMTDVTNPSSVDPPAGTAWLTVGLALGGAVLAAVLRLLPHPANFTMIGALGLWGGARLKPWLGVVLPLIVWSITDIALWQIHGYPYFNPFVYGSFIVYALLGLTLRHSRSATRIGATTLVGSLLFFLVTNFGVWVASWKTAATVPAGKAFIEDRGKYESPTIHYSADLKGLAACYALAVPFIRTETLAPPAPLGYLGNTIAGDVFFCGALFGMHALLLRVASRRQLAPAPVARR